MPAVRLRRLLPDGRESFRYSGSLTTPPFTEPVLLVVLADPIGVSRRQISAFRELFEEGNSREVQPLNGRQVLSDAKSDLGCEDTVELARRGRLAPPSPPVRGRPAS